MTLICPECGTQVPQHLRYCLRCGCPMEYIKAHQTTSKSKYMASSDPRDLLEAAKLGNIDAMYWLGWCLYYGDNGFEENEERARRILEKAARKGHDQAAADLHAWFGESGDFQQPLHDLFERFDNLIIIDLATSGINLDTDQIIEFAAIQVEYFDGVLQTTHEMNEVIALPNGGHFSPQITELTGITEAYLRGAGKTPMQVCQDFLHFVDSRSTLLVAYNAQFHLCFLYEFMQRNGGEQRIHMMHALDVLTVYRDRRPYPHKLTDALFAYHLEDHISDSHRAICDARALLSVLQALDAERQDLSHYIDLFGFLPKYGIYGRPLQAIEYRAQPHNHCHRLYET